MLHTRNSCTLILILYLLIKCSFSVALQIIKSDGACVGSSIIKDHIKRKNSIAGQPIKSMLNILKHSDETERSSLDLVNELFDSKFIIDEGIKTFLVNFTKLKCFSIRGATGFD